MTYSEVLSSLQQLSPDSFSAKPFDCVLSPSHLVTKTLIDLSVLFFESSSVEQWRPFHHTTEQPLQIIQMFLSDLGSFWDLFLAIMAAKTLICI